MNIAILKLGWDQFCQHYHTSDSRLLIIGVRSFDLLNYADYFNHMSKGKIDLVNNKLDSVTGVAV